MTETAQECSAYVKNNRVCSNSFIQRFSCWGDVRCDSCGAVNEDDLPYCMRDELPDHWVKDDGKPLFILSPDGETKE